MAEFDERRELAMTRLSTLFLAMVLVPAIVLVAGPSSTGPGTPARGQGLVERIAAVVNDEVITSSAVLGRLRLALFAAGVNATQENQQRLLPQVLRTLIDENLRMQEAERLNVDVPEEEVDQAIASIARENNMSPAQFTGLLERNNVPVSTLRRQVETSLAWRRLIQRQLLPDITIGEAEVDEVMARIEENRGLPEYLLAEIFLAVDDPAREADVRAFAEELARDIRRGASFSAVAQQFSQGAGAASGGDMGWVLDGQLAPELEAVVEALSPGQMSDPVRTVSGYHILLLRDQRRANVPDIMDDVIDMARLGIPFPANATRADMARIAARLEEVSATVSTCAELEERARAMDAPPTDAGSGRLRDLPPQLAQLLRDQPIEQPTEPVRMSDGMAVFMVCDRQTGSTASREEIADQIRMERLDMLQRRLLRDLRTAAFIDVRL
ncbi:MAG: peptidylprolyl isomerase [Alphaproteobacteria bacterium]|jgi:peptidyl-prolyl cis-trans isomerase SurA|nr:peptidylprolyl isomerase [Alphaproteobacteria bacterium]